MGELTGSAGLAGAIWVELAGDVRGVLGLWRTPRSGKGSAHAAVFSLHGEGRACGAVVVVGRRGNRHAVSVDSCSCTAVHASAAEVVVGSGVIGGG